MRKLDCKYDAALGRAAFERVEPALRDLAADAVEHVSLDLQKAAVAALKLDAVVKREEIRARFDELPSTVFEAKHLNTLHDLAWASWYARSELLAARARARDAQVPLALLEEATETKQRMMKIAEYHLGDDPVAGAEVDSIRLGTGYLDLASDLTRLAVLFETNVETVEQDSKHYRADDVATARRLASGIIETLAEEDDGEWEDLNARVYTMLRRAYDEIRDTGHYLFRRSPERNEFPSLFTVARRRPRRATEVSADDVPVAEATDVEPVVSATPATE